MQLVGYQLVSVKDGAILKEWGGTFGQYPSIPEMFVAPNGDHIYCPSLNTEYSGCMIVEWKMSDPKFYDTNNNPLPIETCQQVRINEVNEFVSAELSKTDWKIIRSTEGYKAVSADTLAYRKAFRDQGNALVSEIESLSDVYAIMAWMPHDWPVSK